MALACVDAASEIYTSVVLALLAVELQSGGGVL
jgi:hypothetical protein